MSKNKAQTYNNGKISILKRDNAEKSFLPFYSCSVSVNKYGSGGEFLGGGAEREKNQLVFKVRYCKRIKEILHDTQDFRIVYDGATYNVIDYDNYNFENKEVKLLGEVI